MKTIEISYPNTRLKRVKSSELPYLFQWTYLNYPACYLEMIRITYNKFFRLTEQLIRASV